MTSANHDDELSQENVFPSMTRAAFSFADLALVAAGITLATIAVLLRLAVR